MSYANGTTHYNLPQTVGTDKRDWFDTNQAFADIDEALYGAVQQSTSTATAVTALTTRVGAVESDVATIQASQSTDEANIAALQTLTSQHTTEIADVKADALDMICAVDEGTAQVATVAVAEGKYFRYNDVLYMATTAIAVGDTIVPNTNCRATNVATELESIQGGETIVAEDVGYDNTTSGLTATNAQDAIDELNADVDEKITFFDTSSFVSLDSSIAQNSSYVAPVDGYYVLFAQRGSTVAAAVWFLDSARSIPVIQSGIGDSDATVSVLPLKAGTTLYTRDVAATYKVIGYSPC